MILKMVLLSTVIGPVTPAMQSGCAPNIEKTNAAINDDSRTSETPYCCVVSMRSREKAMPGRTLHGFVRIVLIEAMLKREKKHTTII